ncbi:MAG: sulfite exporter TauE/SafE family protein [Candidatus Nanopelagicales bacterium]
MTTSMTTQLRVPVAGMTCAACERRVGASLEAIPGVVSAQVSSARGVAVLEVTEQPAKDALAAAVERAGYTLGRTPWLSHDRRTWLVALAAGAVVALLVGVALATGFADLGARMTQPGAGGLVVVALVGLAAGVSTCMALVGGVVLAVAATYRVADDASLVHRMRPHLAFQVGRVLGFLVLGAALGWIGSALVLPPLAQGLLMLAVAAVMGLLGLRLTGLSPRLAAWTPALPSSWGRRVRDTPGGGYSDVRAALAGAATFFLPCGFTQAVQLYALSTGSPWTAGLTMAVFALGTSPGLLALASVPNLTRGRWAATLTVVVGVLLIGFAAVNAFGALNVLGVRTGTSAAAARTHELSSNVTVQDGVQIVTMTADGNGYSPTTTYVAAGVPIRWQITSTAPMYCTAFLRAPDMGVSVQLQGGPNTVEVAPLALGAWPFTCVMGMYNGTLVAVDPAQG